MSSTSSPSPDPPLWEGKVLKKGGGLLSSWQERTLKLFMNRVDYYDGVKHSGTIVLVSSTSFEVLDEIFVHVHTIGRKEKEK